jgi:hypothetical protein
MTISREHKEFQDKMLKILENERLSTDEFTSVFTAETLLNNINANAEWNKEFFYLLKIMNDLADLYNGNNPLPSPHFLRETLRDTLINSIRLSLTFAKFDQNYQSYHILTHLEAVKALSLTLASTREFIIDPYTARYRRQLFDHSQQLLKATDYGYSSNRINHIALNIAQLALNGIIIAVSIGLGGLCVAHAIAASPFFALAFGGLALLYVTTGTVAATLAARNTANLVKGVSPTPVTGYAKNIADSLSKECGVSTTGFFGGKKLVKPLVEPASFYEPNDVRLYSN